LRELERYAALVVLLAGGLEIEIHNGDFAAMPGGEVKHRGTEDGVICDFYRATVFEDQKRGRERRIRIYSRSLFLLRPLGSVRGRKFFHRRNVGAFSAAAPIEHGRSTLVVCFIVGGLLLVVSWSTFDRVRHGHGVPNRADVIRVLAMVMMAIAVTVAVTVTIAVTVVDAVAGGGRCQRRLEWWSIALRSDRGNAGAGAVDGVASEAG
jgi:hypothetical protein